MPRRKGHATRLQSHLERHNGGHLESSESKDGAIMRVLKSWHRVLILLCLDSVLGFAQVKVNGLTADCFADKFFRPSGVDVYVFDSEKVAAMLQLVKQLQTPGNLNDRSLSGLYFARYTQLGRLLQTTPALAKTKSTRTGSFTAEVPSVAGLLIVGYQAREDIPDYWASTQIKVGNRGLVSVTLSFDPEAACMKK